MLVYYLLGYVVLKLKIICVIGFKYFGYYRVNIGLIELEVGFYEDIVSVIYFFKE